MDIYLVVAEDTIVQRREYVVLAKDAEDAKEQVRQGMFVNESEPATIDNKASIFRSSEKIGEQGNAS